MAINLNVPYQEPDLKPRITVIGVGGAGCNAVNNMINQLDGCEFVIANTDAQALAQSPATRKLQLGRNITQGLGAGARPDVGRAAAEEALEEVLEHLHGSNMAFITAGMGGGTGTGAAPVIARAAREQGILTVGVVTKPFQFEGIHRMRIAEAGIEELQHYVDTLIIIPNQNLFRIANEKTTFAEAFKMADNVLQSGVRGVTDLMVMPGLINLDFADVRQVMSEMGKAMMGTGEGEGEKRAIDAAQAAISNPLLDDVSMKGARGVLINITGGPDMTLFEVDEAANRIRDEVDPEANIIFGSTFDESLEGKMRISVIATGIDLAAQSEPKPNILSLVTDNARRPVPRDAARPAAAPAQAFATTGYTPAAAGQAPAMAAPTMSAPIMTATAPALEPRLDAAPMTATAQPAPQPAKPAPTASAPAGAPEAQRPFLPPPPVEPTTSARPVAQPAPRPFAEADMVNAGRESPKEKLRRGLSLFERVTGTGRARDAKAEAAPQPQAQPAMHREPAFRPAPQPQQQVQPAAHPAYAPAPAASAPQPAQTMPAQQPFMAPQAAPQAPQMSMPMQQPAAQAQAQTMRTAEPAQTRLGIEAADKPRGSAMDDDLLDIPAFLRRQAN
jgi:cell division protein FtsZ